MHIDLLNICEESGIRPIAGKRVSYDILKASYSNGLKDFILMPEDMVKFRSKCADALSAMGYVISEGKSGSASAGGFIRIYGQDVLATTIPSLMNDPDATHGPQFIIRQLTETDEGYSFIVNKTTFTLSRSHIDYLTGFSYIGGTVYLIRSAADHIETIYGENPEKVNSPAGYGIFELDCTPEEFIREAKKRGYLTEKRISAYKKHRKWKKENRNPVEEKYRRYQEVLLSLDTCE